MHEYRELTIAAVRRETAEAISVELAVPPALAAGYRYLPGQHLPVRAVLGGAEVRRTYSICSGPGEQRLRIAVKRVAGGVFSNWANDSLRPGQVLEAMPPAGRFVLPPAAGPRTIAAFAAGAGITPVIAMLRHALAAESATRVALFYGNRTAETILFREVLEDLKDRYLGRFTLAHVLSRGEGDTPLLTGRIDAAKVETVFRRLLPPADVEHVFLCGPGTMIRDARTALLGLGMARERIHHEFFAPGGGAWQVRPAALPESPAAREGGAAEVLAVLDGVRHRFAVPAGAKIIDAAQRAGVRLPYSCKGGMCCTCRCKLVAGRVEMEVNYSLEPWELDAGFVLACQSRPLTAAVELDFDQT